MPAPLVCRQFFDFAVQRGQGLLKHLAMGRCFGTLQIEFGPRAGQLERHTPLFGRPLLGRQGMSGIRLSARGFFLLGFYELGVESTCHVPHCTPVFGGNE
jgi:hypothetical protein